MTQIANDFAGLGLSEPLLRALEARDYTVPTPIQAKAIPPLLEGRDLLGIAQTGTGKTAAFALPILQILDGLRHRPRPRMPRALVLAPTRELATQIGESFRAYGSFLRLQTAIVFGGVGQNPQVQALRRGVDILVATPGRLLDLIDQRHCNLGEVEILVLDEADRMLDMGFLPDVRRIVNTLPDERHSLLFSATMPDDITKLAHRMLDRPLRVEATPPAATADRVVQSVWMVEKAQKRNLLTDLLEDPEFVRTLVFTRTKHGADRVERHLKKAGVVAHAIHGNKSQNQRNRALESFRAGKCHVLVATDIAARGIDVRDITHVVNFDLPNIADSYVHRIGRTARAGREGIAISFCDKDERPFLKDIEKLIKQRIEVVGRYTPGREKPETARATPTREAAAAADQPGDDARRDAGPKPRPSAERPKRADAAKNDAPRPWHERYPVERFGKHREERPDNRGGGGSRPKRRRKPAGAKGSTSARPPARHTAGGIKRARR